MDVTCNKLFKMLMGQTLERMKEGYSQIRNEALAYAFSYMNLIEHWGSGIPRIIGKVKAAGLREPEFIGGEVDLRINIYRGQIDGTAEPNHARKMPNSASVMPDSSVRMPDFNQKMPDTVKKMPDNEQERQICQYVLKNGSITTAKVTEILGVKQRRARRVLQDLVEGDYLSLLSASRKISNMIFNLNFYQKDAVGANREAAAYQVYFVDARFTLWMLAVSRSAMFRKLLRIKQMRMEQSVHSGVPSI